MVCVTVGSVSRLCHDVASLHSPAAVYHLKTVQWQQDHLYERIELISIVLCSVLNTNLKYCKIYLAINQSINQSIDRSINQSINHRTSCKVMKSILSPGQTNSQVDASQRKFAKPELAYGLAMGGQTDSQVGSQVAKSRKFHAYHWLMRFYNNRLLAINLCRLALGGQTVKNLRLLASKFELDQSQGKST